MNFTAKLIDMVGDVMIWNEERNAQTQRNWFSRLARGARSFLPGPSGTRSSSNSLPSALPEEETRQLSGPDETLVAFPVQSENSQDILSPHGNREAGFKDACPIPFPGLQGSFTEQSKQRLAGHTTKVRLEAPAALDQPSPMTQQMISETPREILDVSRLSSLPVLGKVETPNPAVRQMISETPREVLDVSLLPSFPATPGRDIGTSAGRSETAKPEAGPAHLPTGNSVNKTVVADQIRLPAGRMFKGNIRTVTRNPLCGTGEFSCGQSDAVIKNPAVRASSVVVVTLTSNPGPVAIHYVSLLPYESFTVHLTAPTTMHTRFNYLIFSGELS